MGWVRRVPAATLLLLALLTMDGSRAEAAGQATYQPSGARVPACAQAGRAIALPRGFPAIFPLPPHAAVTSWQKGRGGLAVGGVRPSAHAPAGGVIVEGAAPAPTFMSVVRFFLRGLPRSGFAIVQSEAEPPNDSEIVFKGHGYLGRLVILGLSDCSSAIMLSIFAEHA